MQKRAFTLIELLVVIAIIAILAAILFPVFAQAKLAAKKTASLSNCKEIDLSAIMYSNDHDDILPMGSGWEWWYADTCGGGGWSLDTQPYIKNVGILRDPTDSDGSEFWPTWMGAPVIEISYGSNGYILGGDPFSSTCNVTGATNCLNRGVIMMSQGPAENGANCYGSGPQMGWLDTDTRSDTAVTQPAATIMFASRFGGQDAWGTGDLITGHTQWDDATPNAIPDGALNPNVAYIVSNNAGTAKYTVNANEQFGSIACPYANQGIFSFVDGHAKTMNPAATNPNPTFSATNASQTNLWDALR